jgi:3-oxoacyl-[acyl-carrier protein] reductase
MLIEGKVALITGSANGIGREISSLFAEHGAHVHLIDRDAERNETVASLIRSKGHFAKAFAADVRDRKALDAVVETAVHQFGRIDLLVNNAGIYPRQTFVGMTESQWDEMQDVNLKSLFQMTQAVLPRMISQKSGKVVNISSVTFYLGSTNLTHYVASKGGVIGFTRSLAREVGVHGIHVNCITPGAIEVEAEKKFVTEEQIREMVAEQSIQRRIMPLDVARVCLFLCSELSDGMTGQSLNVDGGWVMR